MKLPARIGRLERRASIADAGIGEPLTPTIAFYDSVLNETISDEEFARYAGELYTILPALGGMPAEDV
jgi:hypothetical protein